MNVTNSSQATPRHSGGSACLGIRFAGWQCLNPVRRLDERMNGENRTMQQMKVLKSRRWRDGALPMVNGEMEHEKNNKRQIEPGPFN